MTPPLARLAAATLLAALAGCAGAPRPSAPPVNAVLRSDEQGGRFIALIGPRRQHAAPFLGVPGTNFYALRSWVDAKNGEAVHQLYVADSYAGVERNWDAASDTQGKELRFIPISKNKITCDNGCSYAEEFAASFPEATLRASSRGLAVIFKAKSGPRETITVPPELVDKQLAAIEAVRASLPAAARQAASIAVAGSLPAEPPVAEPLRAEPLGGEPLRATTAGNSQPSPPR